MRDMWGKEVKAGAVFVHPHRQSSSIWMNKYVVVSVGDKTVKARRLREDVCAYIKWDNHTQRPVLMTEAEQADSKTVTIFTFSDRSTII